jgi:hypothetical protein
MFIYCSTTHYYYRVSTGQGYFQTVLNQGEM